MQIFSFPKQTLGFRLPLSCGSRHPSWVFWFVPFSHVSFRRDNPPVKRWTSSVVRSKTNKLVPNKCISSCSFAESGWEPGRDKTERQCWSNWKLEKKVSISLAPYRSKCLFLYTITSFYEVHTILVWYNGKICIRMKYFRKRIDLFRLYAV